MKLHALVGCPYCSRVLFELETLQMEYEIVWYTHVDQLKTESYLALNPKGEAPVLELPEGLIYESSAIMRYLGDLRPELKLNGGTPFERGLVDMWILNSATITGPLMTPLFALIGRKPNTKEEIDKCLAQLPEKMKLIEDRLSERTYLVGTSVTNADFCLLSFLLMYFTYLLEEKERHKYPHTLRYYNNLTSARYFTAFFGQNKKMCTKMWKHVAGEATQATKVEEKKTEEKNTEDKKEKKQTKPAESKKDSKKEEPKKEAKKQEKIEEVKKEAPALKRVEIETSFKLFDFKNLFVNELDRKQVVNTAIETYDKNHFSFWHAHYDKHPSEGKELIPFNNLLTNFCQRVADLGLNKDIIGIHGIYGEEPDLQINGLWLWQSADFLQGMKDHPSNEYVQWTKLDPAKPEDRKRIEEYWANIKSEIGAVEGQRCRTLKIVK